MDQRQPVRKVVQAREHLLLDTLRRAQFNRWSELCSGVVVSDGMTEHVWDYARLVLGDDGDMVSCLVARFAYGLRKTHHVTITVVPEKSSVLCFDIGVERCLAVQGPKVVCTLRSRRCILFCVLVMSINCRLRGTNVPTHLSCFGPHKMVHEWSCSNQIMLMKVRILHCMVPSSLQQ